MAENLTKAQLKEQRHQERQSFEEQVKKQEAKNKYKKFGIWILGICILGLSLWGLIALVNVPQPSSQITTIPKVTNKDITAGPKDANITLVEYADFQCPACGAYHPLIKQLMNDFSGKVLFVYRMYPLTNIHKNAFLSAQTAYAAYKQNKFWEMNDLLFTHQQDWAESDNAQDTFNKYAQQLNLNMTTFAVDVNSDATKQFINNSSDAATTAGINSTPTFFINGTQIQNPQNYDAFKQLIQSALK